MKKSLFPALRAEDIKIFIADISEELGGRIVLYFTGELVSVMMDEVFGPMNWSKENNVVSVNGGSKFICKLTATDENGSTASKDGLGVVTEFDPEKGEETDALKRAAYQWGIGRELKHNLPPLYFPFNDMNTVAIGTTNNPKYKTPDEFEVEQVLYMDEESIDRRITRLSILNTSTGKRYKFDIHESLEKKREKIENAKSSIEKKKKAKHSASEEVKEIPYDSSKANDSKADPSMAIIDLPGALDGKALHELAPCQVVWVYQHKDASEALKQNCLLYASTNAVIKNEFLKKGIPA